MGTDYKSGFTIGHLLKKRSESKEKVLTTIALSENQTNNKIKRVHFDLAGEFLDQTLKRALEIRGIRVTTATARTKEQNPIAERKNRTITEKIRAALWDSRLPHTYWGDLTLAAIHISNRMPSNSKQLGSR
jgi:hypothetical protein